MGTTSRTWVQLTILQQSSFYHIKSKMTRYQSNEDNLITFLSGFNQVFLGFVVLNILVAICLGVGVQNTRGSDTVDVDFDFEIKTAMDRSKSHSTFVAGLALLTLSAIVFVCVSRAVQNYRRLNSSTTSTTNTLIQ